MATDDAAQEQTPQQGKSDGSSGGTQAAEAGEGRPTGTVTPEQATIELARRGHHSVLPRLEAIFDAHPALWQTSGDLVRQAEQVWLDRIAGKNLFHSQALRRQLKQLRRDLLGPEPTPTERILVDRIGISWLAVNFADMQEAGASGDGPKAAQVRLRQVESAHRRFHAAVKALAVVRRLAGGLKIEITHSADSAAGHTSSAADERGRVPERLRGALGDAFRGENQFTETVKR